MLVNVYTETVPVIPGTRLIQPTLGVVGTTFNDPYDKRRTWEIQALYAPIPGRALGGIRAKVIDQKGFITFCNQRDLEVLLGVAKPGDYCIWAAEDYYGPDEEEWYGLCCDDEDLLDDLQEKELFYRSQMPGGVLFGNVSWERRVHVEKNWDAEECWVFLQDINPETGFYPDVRFETIGSRWARAERRRVHWHRI